MMNFWCLESYLNALFPLSHDRVCLISLLDDPYTSPKNYSAKSFISKLSLEA